VSLGKTRWDAERPLRLAGEALIGRLGDIATKLPDEVIKATPEVPWREVKGMRIIAAQAYDRIDYEEVVLPAYDTAHPRVARGHVEQLPSGSFRAVVYAGVDPLTRRPVYLRATARTEKQAQVELGKLLGKGPLIKVQAG